MTIAIIVLSTPLLANILAVVAYRGPFRIAAVFLLPFVAGALVGDIYGVAQGGNLAGLLTMLISGPAVVALLLLGIGNVLMRLRRSRSGEQNGSTARRMAVWMTSGALLAAALAGWTFGGPAAFVALLFGGGNSSVSAWLQNHSVGHLAWILGGVIGALGGAGIALIGGRRVGRDPSLPHFGPVGPNNPPQGP